MYCTQCGWKNEEEARFCQRCGRPILRGRQEVGIEQRPGATPEEGLESPIDHGVMTAAAPEYAGFWRRLGAYVIDAIITGVAGYAIGLVLAVIVAYASETNDEYYMVAYPLVSLVQIVLQWVYSAAMESSSKQATVGKMALGIVVTDLRGNRISFGRATARYFSKIISMLTLWIGYIMIGFSQKKQGLHDMMAGCLVVVKRRSPA
ncbi:MAG: hypothetical protein A2Y91_04825 [Chloroflexi bacterium RBG_13_54_8]|nr:MAG: hypothetical protein A2Y91_04825 [Chloroflexi bacterium RBG_13_54_8]